MVVNKTEGNDPELYWRKGARLAEKLLTDNYIASCSLKGSGHFALEENVSRCMKAYRAEHTNH